MNNRFILICFFIASLVKLDIVFASSEKSEYDLDFLIGNSKSEINTAWLSSLITEGYHSVDVSLNNLNGRHYDLVRMKVKFVDSEGVIQPCFKQEQLAILGIKLNVDLDQSCLLLSEINDDAKYNYQSSNSLLEIFIPNINLASSNSKTLTSSELWEDGVDSLKLKYNAYSSSDEHGNIDGYIGVNSILSIGSWRIKHSGSLYKSNSYYQSMSGDVYAFVDIDPLQSQLYIGEIASSSSLSVNSSLPITGFSLKSSELMNNPNWSSYSPVIRGRVNSISARVSVLDKQRVIYSEELSTGDFEIRDFDVSAIGSELSLVVEESDGTIRERTIPYTKLPNMLKESSYMYDVSIGRYESDYDLFDVFTGGMQYGFEHLTADFGMLYSNDYRYFELSNTFDLGNFGAISIGAGYSDSRDKNGYLFQSSYAKNLSSTNTNFQFVGTQYRSRDFLTFDDFANKNRNEEYIKNTIDMSINQNIDMFSVYFGYQRHTYHNNESSKNNLYASGNFMLGEIDISMSITREEQVSQDELSELIYGLNFSIPFGKNDNVRLSNYFTERSGSTSNTLSVNVVDDDYNYNMSFQNDLSKSGDLKSSYSASFNTTTSYADLGVQGYFNDTNKLTLTAKGGSVIYRDGILFSPYINETSAIVDFGDGAEGILLNNHEWSQTNKSGKAIISYSRPYRSNKISIDTTKSYNSEIITMPRNYVPRQGATVLVDVDTLVGLRKFVKIKSNKNFFGESIKDADSMKNISFVGIDNIVYLSGIETNKYKKFIVGNEGSCSFSMDTFGLKDDINEVISVECD